MRYEVGRSDGLIKYWKGELRNTDGETWELYVEYGIARPDGHDMPLFKDTLFSGPFQECKKKLNERIQDRLVIGYKEIP